MFRALVKKEWRQIRLVRWLALGVGVLCIPIVPYLVGLHDLAAPPEIDDVDAVEALGQGERPRAGHRENGHRQHNDE